MPVLRQLKPGLRAFYAIWQENGFGIFYNSYAVHATDDDADIWLNKKYFSTHKCCVNILPHRIQHTKTYVGFMQIRAYVPRSSAGLTAAVSALRRWLDPDITSSAVSWSRCARSPSPRLSASTSVRWLRSFCRVSTTSADDVLASLRLSSRCWSLPYESCRLSLWARSPSLLASVSLCLLFNLPPVSLDSFVSALLQTDITRDLQRETTPRYMNVTVTLHGVRVVINHNLL